MTHSDPQGAPPETDLRAMSDGQVVDQFMAAVQDVNAMIEFREQCALDQSSPEKARLFLNAVGNASIAKVEYEQWRTELLRRLARPDALREKVNTEHDVCISEATAKVALECMGRSQVLAEWRWRDGQINPEVRDKWIARIQPHIDAIRNAAGWKGRQPSPAVAAVLEEQT